MPPDAKPAPTAVTTAPRKRLRRDQRRRVLLVAALEVFGRDGYHAASLDDVAELSAVTKPVVYDHFRSKQELYVAVLEEQAQRLFEQLAEPLDPQSAPLEQRLRHSAEVTLAFANEHPGAWRLLFHDTVSDPHVAAAYGRLRRAASEATGRATASDPDFTPPPGVSRKRASLILGELQRAAVVALVAWAHEHPGVPRRDLIAVFMDFVWIGLERFRVGEHWQKGSGGPGAC